MITVHSGPFDVDCSQHATIIDRIAGEYPVVRDETCRISKHVFTVTTDMNRSETDSRSFKLFAAGVFRVDRAGFQVKVGRVRPLLARRPDTDRFHAARFQYATTYIRRGHGARRAPSEFGRCATVVQVAMGKDQGLDGICFDVAAKVLKQLLGVSCSAGSNQRNSFRTLQRMHVGIGSPGNSHPEAADQREGRG